LRIQKIQEVADETSHVIATVSETIKDVDAISSSISAAVEEQTAATSEIARTISETAMQAQEVEHLMTAVSERVGEANDAAISVRESSEALDEMMGNLGGLMVKAVRTSSEIADRRKRSRRSLMVECDVNVGGRSEAATIYDLSEAGALVALAAPCAEGVGITILIPREGVRMSGTIVGKSDGLARVNFDEDLETPLVDSLARKYFPAVAETTRNDHRAFVARIIEAVHGKTRILPTELSSHQACRLGRWHSTVADQVLTELPAFKKLAEPHRAVHVKGYEILVELAAGHVDSAKRKVAELERSSRVVLDCLESMTREMAQRTG
jgi:hypothetical protein